MLWDKIAKSNNFTGEREMFTQWYLTDKLTIKQIADKLKVGTCTVASHLENLGIDRRPKGGDNCKMDQSFKLFHLDQRVLLTCPAKSYHRLVKVSYSFLYKYQKRRAPYGVLHYFTGNGSANVRDSQPQPLTATANSAS